MLRCCCPAWFGVAGFGLNWLPEFLITSKKRILLFYLYTYIALVVFLMPPELLKARVPNA